MDQQRLQLIHIGQVVLRSLCIPTVALTILKSNSLVVST